MAKTYHADLVWNKAIKFRKRPVGKLLAVIVVIVFAVKLNVKCRVYRFTRGIITEYCVQNIKGASKVVRIKIWNNAI